jgi:adenylosuccinate synthase
LDLERPGQLCLRVADLQDPNWPELASALRAQKAHQAATFGPLDPVFTQDLDLSLPPGVEVGEAPGGPAIAEGAHGLLLDRDIGFFPHVTPSRNHPQLARPLLPQAPVIGALRCWMTRHGAGPLPTEDPTLTLQEPHNPWGLHQGSMRWGHLDLVLLRYAIAQGGAMDALALSWLDQLPEELSVCVDWEGASPSPQARDLQAVRPLYQRWPRAQLLDRLEEALGLPIWICARGPRATDRSWR